MALLLRTVERTPRLRASNLGAVGGLALSALLVACSTHVVHNMFPTPIVMQDERLDFWRTVAAEHPGTEVNVLFATTRAPAPPDAPEHYARSPGDAVRAGVARVQLGEPGWSFEDLIKSDLTSRPEAPRPARVVAVQEFGAFGAPQRDAERAFVAAVDRQVEKVPDRSVVIYIPGYRATFDQVTILMGSWAHFLGRDSAVIAFSWPTGTRPWNYLFDCRRARAFVPDIARLIALVAEQSQARRLNVLAFSCGGPLLAEALVQLREAHADEDRTALQQHYRIANGLFIAADIDLQTFARSHLPALLDIAGRTEVYLSENDGALKFAALLARASRLGRPRFEELTREELETLANNDRLVSIDVTDVEGAHELTGMRGHGYWFANQRVSSDVLLSMMYPFDPAWRGLVHGAGLGLWTFPADYPRRVGDAVYEAAPQLRRYGK
ncbi:MAG: alpha/beta hydrolase [Gammaproteobacteria bacterium]|nr:alpha/beta hydrolase [Gammaproteobacteria bacterium]